MFSSLRNYSHVLSTSALMGLCGGLCACQPSIDANAKYALPQALTLLEQSDARIIRTCPDGGARMVHGLDHDSDGKLAPYERLGVEYICNGAAIAQGLTTENVAQGLAAESVEPEHP